MKRITLILGAGVNKEINPGIDLGSELLQDILDRVTDQAARNNPYLSNLLNSINISKNIRERFVKDLNRYKIYHEYASVDDFLYRIETLKEFEENKVEYLKIAKISIIFHVLGFEGTDTKKSITRDISFGSSWLNILYRYITKNVLSSQSVSLNIVTFNYDRIVEHYLLETFKNNSKIRDFIDANIHHVYGRIGCLEHLTPKQLPGIIEKLVPFGLDNDQIHTISGLTDHIKLIYEEREVNSCIKKVINESDELLIMGYGFDYINNIKIGLNNLSENTMARIAIHSNLNVSKEQRIKAFISNAHIEKCSCSEFLNRYCLKVK
jgi:hypothetical protein